ncbi:MAG: EcsC family protein [Burkholderiaceae bacterium]|nr:EcsC family protein [Burkholderiaceae bacterium]
MKLDAADLRKLEEARELLERPGLAARLSDFLGGPIERTVDLLPPSVRKRLGIITHHALQRSVDAAARTLEPGRRQASPRLHKLLGSVSGGAGGALGIAGLSIEIPLSTVLIMRSILDVARAEGEDPGAPDTRMAALEVFALGGDSPRDDAAESGYYAVRAVLARAVSEASRHVAQRGITQEGAPAMVRLIAMVATRYKIQLTQKAAGMLVPGVGAAAGAAINLLFMDHYQTMSRGHFAIRALERRYGAEVVRQAYRTHPRRGFEPPFVVDEAA